ncbi:hypothetical protein P9314_22860 [Paenibacillus validus]|uniref:Fimbrial assembly protein n=1 Tax=Paenibacillus validus TaxID=44253 RepID=A0A7X3CRC5_9BACL|nr:hypothetical protein [Paenibacillus validus]MED4603473.1 hypothetical protein [Paenibacillus validus]MED4608841.1 hypothetical protein [Paenibacillus validus]MUG69596.1 hypothetical protein [Paenibacillus validus]
MMNINLVPKIPKIQKYFVPLLVTSGAASALAAVLLVTFHFYLEKGLSDKAVAVERLQAEVRAVTQQRVQDPITADFHQFANEIQKLKNERYDWIPVFELLTSQLPEASRLLNMQSYETAASAAPNNAAAASMASEPQRSVKLLGEFASLQQSMEYMVRLQQSALIEAVHVESITRAPLKVTADAGNQPVESGSGANAETGKIDRTEAYIQSLENSLKPEETKGDQLLNELNWMITKQMVDQQFDLQIPDTPDRSGSSRSDVSAPSAAGKSAITAEDISQAQQQLEQFKKQSPSAYSNQTPSNRETGASSNAAVSEPTTVFKYSVTIEVKLKAKAISK